MHQRACKDFQYDPSVLTSCPLPPHMIHYPSWIIIKMIKGETFKETQIITTSVKSIKNLYDILRRKKTFEKYLSKIYLNHDHGHEMTIPALIYKPMMIMVRYWSAARRGSRGAKHRSVDQKCTAMQHAAISILIIITFIILIIRSTAGDDKRMTHIIQSQPGNWHATIPNVGWHHIEQQAMSGKSKSQNILFLHI